MTLHLMAATDPFGDHGGAAELDLGLEELESAQADLDLSSMDADLRAFETNVVVQQALAQQVGESLGQRC